MGRHIAPKSLRRPLHAALFASSPFLVYSMALRLAAANHQPTVWVSSEPFPSHARDVWTARNFGVALQACALTTAAIGNKRILEYCVSRWGALGPSACVPE